jgi:hypothetical protein
MRRRWWKYALVGLIFGVVDWYFLDLLASLSRFDALNDFLEQAPALVRLLFIALIIGANYGIWLVPVIPGAIYEMRKSGSLRSAALSGVIVWSMAMVSYYSYYALILMFVGAPHLEFMLFANRAAPTYWADWWPPFKRVIVDQFVEWIGIAIVGGGVAGALTGYVFRSQSLCLLVRQKFH